MSARRSRRIPSPMLEVSLLGQRDTTPEKQLKISLIASYSIDSRAFLEEAKPTWLHEAVNTRKNPLSWLSKHEI